MLSVHFANICTAARGRVFGKGGSEASGSMSIVIPTLLTHTLRAFSALHKAICASPEIQVMDPG